MELLRITAMLLVMIVHANFRALPVPTLQETISTPFSSLSRFFTESLSIVCVDVFILLSGWYGIKFRWKRLAEFVFQILFFVILISGFIFIVKHERIDIFSFFLGGKWDYWFIKAYVGLYIFSPLLNIFANNSSKKEYETFLILFFSLQITYGWLTQGAAWFNRGYSAISFIGLYMLARYIKLHHISYIQKINKNTLLFLYIFITLIQTGTAFLCIKYNHHYLYSIIYLYTSPIIILQSLSLLLFFSKLNINSIFINWVASSCFAIYLLHSNSLIAKPYYDSIILKWFNEESTWTFILYSGFFITFVFVLSILLDKIRIVFWKILTLKILQF